MSGLGNDSDETSRGKPEPRQVWTIVPKETLAEAAMCDPDNAYIVTGAVADIKELLVSAIGTIENPPAGVAYSPERASSTLWKLKRLLNKEFGECLERVGGAAAWFASPPAEFPFPPNTHSLPVPAESPHIKAQRTSERTTSVYRAIESLWHPVAVAAVAIEMCEAEGGYPHDEDEGAEMALQTMESLGGYLARERNECIALIDGALVRLGLV